MRATCFRLAAMLGAALLTSAASRTDYLNRLPLRFEENLARDRHPDARYIARAGSFVLTLAPSSNYLSWTDPVKKNTMECGRDWWVRIGTRGWNRRAVTRGSKLFSWERVASGAPVFLDLGESFSVAFIRASTSCFTARSTGWSTTSPFPGSGSRCDPVGTDRPSRPARRGFGRPCCLNRRRGDPVEETRNISGTQRRSNSVVGGFRVLDGRLVTFNVGSYNPARELVIDPTLAYSTYLGAAQNECGRGIGVDGAGNVYIAGNTNSTICRRSPRCKRILAAKTPIL